MRSEGQGEGDGGKGGGVRGVRGVRRGGYTIVEEGARRM